MDERDARHAEWLHIEHNLNVRFVGADVQTHLLTQILNGVSRIMATVDEVKAAIAEEAAEVKARVDALDAQVVDLKNQIAAGTAATPAQLDEIIAGVRGIFTPAA